MAAKVKCTFSEGYIARINRANVLRNPVGCSPDWRRAAYDISPIRAIIGLIFEWAYRISYEKSFITGLTALLLWRACVKMTVGPSFVPHK